MTPRLADFEDVFVALSDSSRRSVLEHLARNQECSATRLAAELPISRQAVMKHLVFLERTRLVDSHRRGREVLYRLQPARLVATAYAIEAIASDWDRKLDLLKRFAEKSTDF